MHTSAAARLPDASFTPWTDASTREGSPTDDVVLGTRASAIESAASLRFPVQQLYAELATAATVRALMAALAEQSRAIALVREARALGAATLPPEVAAALERAAAVMPLA